MEALGHISNREDFISYSCQKKFDSTTLDNTFPNGSWLTPNVYVQLTARLGTPNRPIHTTHPNCNRARNFLSVP